MKSFTLAEVLITLGIIGIVAAMTMPTIIGNYQKQVTINRLKKAYTVTAQAIELSKAEYGDLDQWEWSSDTTDFFDKYIVKNMKLTKNCKLGSGCWNKQNKVFGIDGSLAEDMTTIRAYKVAITDGTYIGFINQYGDDASSNHAHIYFDINGERGPNKYGKDCYILTLTSAATADYAHNIDKAGLYFFGSGITRDALINNPNLTCKNGGTGRSCGELIFRDGWQMKNDYPW